MHLELISVVFIRRIPDTDTLIIIQRKPLYALPFPVFGHLQFRQLFQRFRCYPVDLSNQTQGFFPAGVGRISFLNKADEIIGQGCNPPGNKLLFDLGYVSGAVFYLVAVLIIVLVIRKLINLLRQLCDVDRFLR